ncbi:cysteine desulfurase [Methanolobus sp.]|uniref:aminotransferase class V-fold PLP-dependent enzyme n=1 Tax=Methanolobus sp. TaxID=1874737 RepID=UPI0025E8ADDC|nr:cysteine desulfurase [Methanolobus sp.]
MAALRNIELRKDFPLLNDVIYFDNAATSLIPEPVIDIMNEFERMYRANVGRGVHRLTSIASQKYFNAHQKVAHFIGADAGTTVLAKNTTEAINMVAYGLKWSKGDSVVTTVIEHHSNFLPWMRLRQKGVGMEVILPQSDGTFDLSDFELAINDNTRLVAVSHASNVLGTILPVKEIAAICEEHDTRLLVDGAQSAPHLPVNVMDIGCDYFCFSGHKMLGPTGTGILWMKDDDISPLLVGGGMIESVSIEEYTLAEGYQRHEAGTPHIAGMIGLGGAAEYLEKAGMNDIKKHEEQLTLKLLTGLASLEHVHIYGPENDKDRIGVVSFNIEGMHPHEVSHILDEASSIMTRSGEHCCQPLMNYLGLPGGTVRVSLYLYNTEEEIDLLLDTLDELTRRL